MQMQMRMRMRTTLWSMVPTLALVGAACGSGAVGTDPGGGSKTLTVDARISHEGGAAEVRVSVERAGAPVLDAVVTGDSELGELSLAHVGGGEYRAVQAGWAEWYGVRVEAGEDWLDGAIEAPELPLLLGPAGAFDPHAAPTVLVAWGGALSHWVKVKTKEFDWEGVDAGELEIPATVFVEESQELELDRRNSTPLAGGTPGSELRASVGAKSDLIVLDPY